MNLKKRKSRFKKLYRHPSVKQFSSFSVYYYEYLNKLRMIQVRIKRVYEDFSETDGYRVLVDKLWPRGMKKEWLKYDYWAKDITPSASLRSNHPKLAY